MLPETIVALVESLLYARVLKLSGFTPYLLSLLLNLASFLTGLYPTSASPRCTGRSRPRGS